MGSMTKDQVIEHFRGRALEYEEMAREVGGKPLSQWNFYQGVSAVIEAFWWLCDFMGRPERVLELGCGAGTWWKFWVTGLGISYQGVDTSEAAIEAAWKMWPPGRFKCQDITDEVKPLFPDHPYDFIFIHGVFMHLPPDDLLKVISWMRKVGKPIMLCEKVRWAEKEKPAPHVWIHDYSALFGQEPSYHSTMNRTKDIFIFRPNTQAGGF